MYLIFTVSDDQILYTSMLIQQVFNDFMQVLF